MYRILRIFTYALISNIPVAGALLAEGGPLGFGQAEYIGELESDRPDFTEATSTIEYGHLQLEGGYTYVRGSKVGNSSHSFPELLIRIGVCPDFELRLGPPGYTLGSEKEDQVERNFKGVDDSSIGFKSELMHGNLVDISLIGELSLPTGREGVGSGELEPGVKLLWSSDITERVSLGGNINLTSVEPSSERYYESAASLALGVPIYDNLQGYLEYFGIYPWEKDDDSHYINGGVTFSVIKDLQLDLRVGAGLTSESDDLFAGIGFVFRI